MSNRVVMIMIPKAAMDVLDFTCILNSLPLGSNVVDVRDCISIGYYGIGFVIENSKFEEVPQGQEMGKVYPETDFGGTYYIQRSDLPIENSANGVRTPPLVLPNSGRLAAGGSSPTHSPRYMGMDDDGDVYLKPDTIVTCVHDWVDYQGITNNFTYCSKCDKKKDS